ncbi:MAG: hypothetical protein IBJ16_06605 [Chitinophagaceae bacterium]|nr:hypothetical protein [Chitinophagaceae bacterium]
MELYTKGQFEQLVPPVAFQCKPLLQPSLPVQDQQALDAFNKKTADLYRAVTGANAFRQEMVQKLPYLQKAALDGAGVPVNTLQQQISNIQKKLEVLNQDMNGDLLRGRYEGATPISLTGRIGQISNSLWRTTSAPTETFKASYDVVASQFEGILERLRSIDVEIKNVESLLEKYKAPYTPGRLPEWKKQ